VVVVLVAAAGTPEAEVEVQGPAVVGFQAGGFSWWGQVTMELAAVEVASALAECACQWCSELEGGDPFSSFGHHARKHQVTDARAQASRPKSRSSRIRVSLVCAITSHVMMPTGTMTGTGGILTLTMSFFVFVGGFCGTGRRFFPWDYLPYYPDDYYPYDYDTNTDRTIKPEHL